MTDIIDYLGSIFILIAGLFGAYYGLKHGLSLFKKKDEKEAITQTPEDQSWAEYFGEHKNGAILLVFIGLYALSSMIGSIIVLIVAVIVAVCLLIFWKPKKKEVKK